MAKLQPFFVFQHEIARLNRLYWTSKYSYSRMAEMIRLISKTGHSSPDPRVDSVWPSVEPGEASTLARTVSDFTGILELNAEALRTTSILHICSAFENALASYYALCALYEPQKVDPKMPPDAVPGILKGPTQFDNLKKWAIGRAASKRMKGTYSKRLDHLERTFGLSMPASIPYADLDAYYSDRHLIAHDQGLAGADAPDLDAKTIIATRLVVAESKWKDMLAAFASTVAALDGAVQRAVVRDGGLALAIYHILKRDGAMQIGLLRHKVGEERRLEVTAVEVEKSISRIGGTATGDSVVRKKIASL